LVARQGIAADLMTLGVSSGDTVMLHASVEAIGWIVGGADRIPEAVFDVVGEAGTLMMYVGWDGSPYGVTLGLAELPPALAAVWPAYDPQTAHAACATSILTEYLRTRSGSFRSSHPEHSFVAVGRLAEELTRDHPLQYGMGPGSPLAKLCEAKGKVVLLGSPLAHLTLLHHAEHLAQVPNKEVARYWAPIVRDGTKLWIQIEEFSTEGCLSWYGPTDPFEAIVGDYLKQGRGAVGHVGAARSHLFDAADLVEFAVGWIEERLAEREPLDLGVEVRRAAPSDHRELVALLGMYEEEVTGTGVAPARLSSRIDEYVEDRDRGTYVATAGEHVVGMIVASRPSPSRGTIELAFVEPEYRRRGVLRELEIEATVYLSEAGCRIVEVEVGAMNEAAWEAWRALGYTPTRGFMERPL